MARAKANNGITDLMRAASGGDFAAVQTLLSEEAAGVNAKDIFGRTALMYAASAGHTNIVLALLDGGADAQMKNVKGGTALELAKARGYDDIVELLDPHEPRSWPRETRASGSSRR